MRHRSLQETERRSDVTHDVVPAKAASPAPRRAARWTGRAVFLLVLAGLFVAYLRLSKTYPENSDEANILLMASDLAHGNLYLSGWTVSDVPFITTELPEIALLVKLFGLHLDTAHIAAALTYTVVVAIALLLAKGRARGPRAIARMGIALAIMLAPQPGVGVFVMVFSVGHIGTAAPVMLTWLVLDRYWPAGDAAGRAPRRLWFLPVAVGTLLAWALMADPLVLVIAVCPVLVVAGLRLVTGLLDDIQNGSVLRHPRRAFARRWLEASLAAAAGLAYLVAWCGGKLLHAAGGYTQQPVPFTLDPVSTWHAHSLTAAHGLLEMFGAFFLPGNAVNRLGPGNDVAAPPLSGLAEAVAVTRLACVALAIVGACAIARRFFRRDADLVSQLLLAGIVANLAAYLPSSLAGHTALNAREFAPVLPFAAILAARTLGDSLLPGGRPTVRTDTKAARLSQLRALALVALLGWYGFGLFLETTTPAAPNPFARLEAFLWQHHLTEGVGGYWDSSVITVGTDGAVTIRAVTGCLRPYDWESKPAWYDPAGHTASFMLESSGTGYFSHWLVSPVALRRLGALLPAASRATLDAGEGYTVHAYQGNLLAQLPLISHC
jgi:hypothetical protein